MSALRSKSYQIESGAMMIHDVPETLADDAVRDRLLQRRRFLAAAVAGIGGVGLAAAGATSAQAAPIAPALPASLAKKQGSVPVGTAEVWNVHDFGAVGDGSTDDAAAIQAAIDAAAAAGGGTVYLPAGRFAVSQTLQVTSSHLTMRGEGTSSVILGTFAAGDVISVHRPSGSSANIIGTAFEQFAITASVAKTSGAAISFAYVQDCRVISIQCAARDVAQAANNLYDGLVFRNFTAVLVETAMIGVQRTALTVVGDASGFGADIWVTGGTLITGNAIGVHVGGGVGGLYLDEVDLYGNGTHVLVDDAIAGIANRELLFNNCVLDTATGHGVEVKSNGVYVLSFIGTYGGNSGYVAKTGHPDGCIVRVHAGGILHPSSIVVNGCNFFNAYGDGIYAESGAWAITGCDISLNGQGSAGGYGVLLEGSATSESMIVGNALRLNGAYPSAKPIGVGIGIGSGVDRYLVSSNIVTSNGTAGIDDNGGSTKVVANNLG
jgi:hypothetical protein